MIETHAAPNAPSRTEREAMLASVQKLIRAEIARAGVPKRHREDCEQECALTLWPLTEKFDPTRGTKWSTYAVGCLRNTLKNWMAKHRCEDQGTVVSIGGARAFDDLWRDVEPDSRTNDEPPEAEDGTDSEAVGALANAVRRKLAASILDKLGAGWRRLVERVAFDGLSADQIAEQDGVPVKVVRCNLKNALRHLCKLGLTSHVVSDQEVAAATAPQVPIDRQKANAAVRKQAAARQNAAVVSELEAAASADGFTVELDRLDDDMRVIVCALIDRSFTVDEAVELLGGNRRGVVGRLKNVVQAIRRRAGNSTPVDRVEALTW
jgi:RNA polymerase sigma factor (sigma-70 family)